MSDRTLERRLRAMEKRMGIGEGPLRALSDLDLQTAIEAVATQLAADGHEAAMATLATQDAQEADWRAFYERADSRSELVLETGVRWPYLRARERWTEAQRHYAGPASAMDEAQLWQKLMPVIEQLDGTAELCR